MVEPNRGIGNVTPNTGSSKWRWPYSRSRLFARLHVSELPTRLETRCAALDSWPKSVRQMPLRSTVCFALSPSIGVTEETTPEHFRLTPFGEPLRRDVPQSVWAAVIFWADLLADDWSLLTDCVRTGKPALRSVIRKYLRGGRRTPRPVPFFAP